MLPTTGRPAVAFSSYNNYDLQMNGITDALYVPDNGGSPTSLKIALDYLFNFGNIE